jgi:3-oxoisoapionate decarboxylase
MGLVIHSYWRRWQGDYSSIAWPAFRTPLDVLDHVRGLGISSLQTTTAGWTVEMAQEVRRSCESYGLGLEGSVRLPDSDADLPRFESELRHGKEAGARVFRSYLGGRRYEDFSTLQGFQDYSARCWRSFQLAEPVLRRHRLRLGVENHKDFHGAELAAMLAKLASEHLGACIDLGNNLALLEDPAETISALAPYAVTTHIKDMAVQEYEEGFLMSEVPLGEGILDLPAILKVINAANPDIIHHLEMITRDPLRIPCLAESYWPTFPDKPAEHLARTLRLVRTKKAAKLPHVTGRSMDDALAYEEQNILHCLRHAGEHLGFDHIQVRKASDEKEER